MKHSPSRQPLHARCAPLVASVVLVCAVVWGLASAAHAQEAPPLRLPPPADLPGVTVEPAPERMPGFALPSVTDPMVPGAGSGSFPPPGIDPLPPLGATGPVVLDMPYEAMPPMLTAGFCRTLMVMPALRSW